MGDGGSGVSLILKDPSKSSDDNRNGEFGRAVDEDMASVTICVVAVAFTGEDERANGGRRRTVVGRVEDMEERTDAVRRLMLIAGVPLALAGLAVTLTLEVEARGEVPATCKGEGRCRGEGFGESRGVRRSCVGGDMDDAGGLLGGVIEIGDCTFTGSVAPFSFSVTSDAGCSSGVAGMLDIPDIPDKIVSLSAKIGGGSSLVPIAICKECFSSTGDGSLAAWANNFDNEDGPAPVLDAVAARGLVGIAVIPSRISGSSCCFGLRGVREGIGTAGGDVASLPDSSCVVGLGVDALFWGLLRVVVAGVLRLQSSTSSM